MVVIGVNLVIVDVVEIFFEVLLGVSVFEGKCKIIGC